MSQLAYDLAREQNGLWEWSEGHNPKIVSMFAEVGYAWVKDDETPWCAAFVGAMLKRAGLPHTGKLNARSYQKWGEPVALEDAQHGDVVVFTRGNPNGWQGHVGFYNGHDATHVSVLGGNQANQVNIKRYPRSRLLAVRRTKSLPPKRTSAGQSSTIKAVGGGSVATIGGVAAVLGKLDPNAQIVAIVACVVVLAAFVWIGKERLKKISAGIG